MASLHLPCATTPLSLHRSSTSPLLPKQSHSLICAKRSHRLLRVTSAASEEIPNNTPKSVDSSPTGKVDRRNMLLGLGGLYGATNLITPPRASANPVQAPDISNCGAVSDAITKEELTGVKCCPPVKDRIIDYRLPPVLQMKVRPSAHRVDPDYIYKYNLAIDRMRRLPADDPRSFMQQANVHCAYCNGAYKQGGGDSNTTLQVHNSWLFFPFHRWYLYFYERILGKLIGDPTFALPFWNWDNPKGMTIPPMFDEEKSALYDKKRNQAHRPPAIIDLGMTDQNDPLQLVSNNLTIMYTEMIRGNANVIDFMGKPYRLGCKVDPGPGASERGSHTAVHVWVGDDREDRKEDMGNFYSAGRDPLFYCHHGNVDRMWTLWQYFLPSNDIPDKKITDPDFLNASFLFYDENSQLVRVYVKDALDNLRMGYDYERIDLPWLDYRPPRQSLRAKINRTSSTAPKASTLFPLTLNKVVKFQVDKTKKGKADELLVLEDITVDTSKFLKFDVFINDEDDNALELDKAAYLGTYAQVPHRSDGQYATSSIRLKLTDLYNDMDVEDDDTVVVTLVPRHKGPGVTIGGIKIIENPTKESKKAIEEDTC
ncbi:hypothetical protein ACS0TY_018707 [Phlomoides rotata]